VKPYLLRPYDPGDEAFCVDSWLRCLAVSRTGRAAGASVANSSAERVWRDEHRPALRRLLETEATCLVDPADASLVWGYACTAGDGVVHAALIKRAFHQQGFAGLMFGWLLGERLEREQVFTMQLTDMSRAMCLPAKWRHDETWFARRIAA
jgi:hypothetical protein